MGWVGPGIRGCSSGCSSWPSATATGWRCRWMPAPSGRGRGRSYRQIRWQLLDLALAAGCSRGPGRRALAGLRAVGGDRVPSCRATERTAGRVRHHRAVSDARTIVFFPEGAFGPTNNCVGIGQVLRARGHRVVFIVEESFAGTLEAKGFEERLMRLGPKPEVAEVPGQFWIDFIRDTAPVFRKPTIVQLEEFIAPTWAALIEGAKYVDDRLTDDHRRARPGRHRRGQRRWLPGARRIGPTVGPDRLVQPGRAQGSGRAAVFVGSAGRGSGRLAGVPGRGRPNPSRPVGRFRRVLPGARRYRAPVWPRWPRLHRRVAVAEPVPLSRGGRLRAPSDHSRRRGIDSIRRCGPRTRPGSCPSTCAARTAR